MTTSEYITDLRAENETMKSERSFANEGMRTIRAENAKLRAALEQAQRVLAIAFNPGDDDEITLLRSTCQHTANICSGAIAGKGAE